MLLTITYKGENSSDLGYLLHKNPSRPQVFELTSGKAYVFYPEVNDTKTTAALLLDINPIDLARGKLGSKDGGLFDYVNDRPYVSSSFMSNAITKVFSTALSGVCKNKPELVSEKLDLEAEVFSLPCSGGKNLIAKIFEPLGYEVEYTVSILDEKFIEWGESKYVNLRLKGKVKLSDLLNHLYVLLPVFDNQKHYWIAKDEIEKLISHGEGWLPQHPEKNLIAARYLGRKKSFITDALKRLSENEEDLEDEKDVKEKTEKELRLNDIRLNAVVEAVKNSGAKTVIDLGCGEVKLIFRLLENKHITKITGVDVSTVCLERAASKLERMPERVKDKVNLLQGSLTYKDKRFEGYDAACVVEVIEHLDINRLVAFERVLFEFAAPPVVILTTPNKDYNINYVNLKDLRHSDHRFEWTKKEFREWAERVAGEHNYQMEFSDIGTIDEKGSTPTQMCVFRKGGQA